VDTTFFGDWIRGAARLIHEHRAHLTRLDAVIGDADHGANLDRGFTAIVQALAETPADGPGELLTMAGTTLIRRVGGASGPLYGTFFRQAGKALGDAATVSPGDLVTALEAGLAGVQKLGGAQPGDKTMVDALTPAIEALARVRDGVSWHDALSEAADASERGAQATVPLQARKGRASYLGERSIGHEDPGAASSALLFRALNGAEAR
jgi:dihydroxyacetone kinase-like protein